MPKRLPRWLKFEKFETFEDGPYKGEPRLVYRNLRTRRLVRKPAGWVDPGGDPKFEILIEKAVQSWGGRKRRRA
ncbi:MAG TPA: hypothetical protein VI893_04330 [Thermoplasmata archaeon]|nr:hypothetical protein [Thermoplasmata archaeon]